MLITVSCQLGTHCRYDTQFLAEKRRVQYAIFFYFKVKIPTSNTKVLCIYINYKIIKAVTTEINEKVNSFKEDNNKNTVEFENITTSLNFTKGKFTQAFLLVFYQMLFSF